MKFPQDFIEKVRDATNLVDIISQHVELKRSGNGLSGLCPFHGEKTPSFSVSEEKQVYHCFGCKASGNVYTFLQQYQGLTFPEAVELLAQRAAIPLPESSTHSDNEQKERATLLKINEVAVNFFEEELKSLKDDHPAWQYLKRRNISREFATKHRLGFAPDGWTGLVAAFEAKRVPLFMAASLGLVKTRGEGKQGYYDLFRNRIMFPIFSTNQQCLGFGGRVLDDSQPKYLNSPDSPLFHKGKIFYGLDRSAKHIRAAGAAILVEGYTDWLALERAGFLNVVATLGTAFTPNHAHLLTRYCSNVIVLFDGDSAGRLAARRGLGILLAEGLYPKGVTLPYDLDPDEFLESQGAPALRHALDKAPDLYDLIVEEEVRGHAGEPSEKVQILDRLSPYLNAVKDPRLRALYVRNTAGFLNIDEKLVQLGLQKPASGTAPSALKSASGTAGSRVATGNPTSGTAGLRVASLSSSSGTAETAPAGGADQQTQGIENNSKPIEVRNPPRLELDLLNLALWREPFFREIVDSGIVPKLSHSGIREVFAVAVEAYGQSLCKFDNLTTLLVARVRPSETVTQQLEEPLRSLTEETAKKYVHDCIHRIEENYRRAQAKVLMSDLRGAQGEKRTEKMEQFMNIQRTRRQPSQENS